VFGILVAIIVVAAIAFFAARYYGIV